MGSFMIRSKNDVINITWYFRNFGERRLTFSQLESSMIVCGAENTVAADLLT